MGLASSSQQKRTTFDDLIKIRRQYNKEQNDTLQPRNLTIIGARSPINAQRKKRGKRKN